MQIQDILAIAACIGGVCMAASPLLQVYRMIHLGDARAVSVPFLLVVAVGAAVWLAYAISITNWAMIIANSVGVGVASFCALVAHRMHHKLKNSHPD